ncbi:MAG: ribosome assembly cofactor RimP [Bacteroidales bacterium]|jgi:ribosome maturation factor RimP|nr:ribosome assembly cofactor RimP [Bacteroidales bacterium]
MIDKVEILNLVREVLDGTDKFLVDLHISRDNRINISIDGDNGITIDDCIELSRHVEGHLNRDVEDFELNVASAGLDCPLKMVRQYKKNVGRSLKVETADGNTRQGELLEATDEKIVLKLDLTKKQKKEGVSDVFECLYKDIKTAKIVIKF